MSRDDPPFAPDLLARPAVSLIGEVNEAMARALPDQLHALVPGEDPVVIEVSTLGGDAEMARRIVLDLDLARRRLAPRRLVFLGKSVIYSAGVTVMAAFPRQDRFVSDDSVLLVHVRQLEKSLTLQGPMRDSLAHVEALAHEIRTGMELEEANFRRLIEGSKVALDDLLKRARHNWYIAAQEAADLGLVAQALPVRA